MKNVYKNLEVLDKRIIDKYILNEEILIENAANVLCEFISKITHKMSVVTIICGGGNNGADGYALARKLVGNYFVRVYIAKEPKTAMCQIQYDRAMEAGVEKVKKILPCDILVDCLFGSGFAGDISIEIQKLISEMNKNAQTRIACDIPSGIDAQGNINHVAFMADYTVSMGALKSCFFSDSAKEYIGEILVADLGVSRKLYEIDSHIQLLEKSDMDLPHREKRNVHKGDFGHLCVYVGDKSGAGLLSALAGFAFGAGLVSVMGKGFEKPIELMSVTEIPENAKAFVIGMGMGTLPSDLNKILHKVPCVFDADMFYQECIVDILKNHENLVLTPHPKEFVSLLKICKIADITVEELSKNKMEILTEFASRFPKVVILLKGTNTLIVEGDKIYINTFGIPALAKGGTGDVLSGMVGALIAQGYDRLKAAIVASLAHSFGARKEKSTYGLTPLKLIENIKDFT
ncbi:bifunctional ADP-dependent (S)-NAD(P)H-hydrate dehydratase/NAD(P)H-hydrate epimerase [Helicobacter sp. 13S00482-2]|uniref:NAD(P)H-hydrate dehydratase n=1 Tax=Helicobacter sp. 13S00482-2 TaxID=1476200 RepID=UPI000BA58F6C|nr:NAD(P)H-hydrate dehydratase [Helicobacter sp. 13S00482-2]PAF54286.1 bifunctional ADP-dependent (S)-NAD(P)H-hydrate dehydratase/NAD(P)H-hydrate epimerase [Helicobacter sp. 13S00482-2]